MSRESLTRISKLLEEETRENRKVCEIGNRSTNPPVVTEKAPEHPLTDEEKYGPKPAAVSLVSRESGSGKACAKCSVELTHKEVAFCRYNFVKLGRRYLCRGCQ
jgi:hypothetical protein